MYLSIVDTVDLTALYLKSETPIITENSYAALDILLSVHLRGSKFIETRDISLSVFLGTWDFQTRQNLIYVGKAEIKHERLTSSRKLQTKGKILDIPELSKLASTRKFCGYSVLVLKIDKDETIDETDEANNINSTGIHIFCKEGNFNSIHLRNFLAYN